MADSNEFDTTIFEQDGTVYFACVMNPAHAKDTAKEIAREIRAMGQMPRARMRVISTAQLRDMPFGSPKDCTCAQCQRDRAKLEKVGILPVGRQPALKV